MPDCILGEISLTGGRGKSGLGGLRKLGLLSSGYLLVLAMIPRQAQWIERTTGTAVVRWIR